MCRRNSKNVDLLSKYPGTMDIQCSNGYNVLTTLLILYVCKFERLCINYELYINKKKDRRLHPSVLLITIGTKYTLFYHRIFQNSSEFTIPGYYLNLNTEKWSGKQSTPLTKKHSTNIVTRLKLFLIPLNKKLFNFSYVLSESKWLFTVSTTYLFL